MSWKDRLRNKLQGRPRLLSFLRGLYHLRYYFSVGLVSLILGIFFSQYFFNIQSTGLLGMSSFEHSDFKVFFLDNYKTNHTYYDTTNKLVAKVQNTFSQGLPVGSELKVPDFIKVECQVDKPTDDSETCDNYLIPPNGGARRLNFNITVGETPKTEWTFCLVTKAHNKWLGLVLNDEEDCIDVKISQD